MADSLSAVDVVFSGTPVPDDERARRPKLIRATADALLLSNGQIVVIALLKPEEKERFAVEQRAESGVVPYGLWVALTSESRSKLEHMSQATARRVCQNY
jgi:hypothetical protein